ncbi:helix-turn-helix domain-containing protein [Mannheimia pernigra]|uniref:helix-turn-helix domain-containing protein n=1 Tax=Mannheimia pernigra TaxID=111844 RepID=UPI00159F3864|nr:helix-turn-helix transcriptional regulator [Mannheimia pernigra]QLB45314.1 helix-turn-helix transcriptional regulator [Mannheimia pernigra]QLB45318.1 helix-turn-helix transcriptional regulator [Mannheimia pernigra]QLB45339.1 helix-turn-helix transcriptional regulator [Mannheimia pernigra]
MKTLSQYISELPVERQARIKEKADELILETGLAMLRDEVNLSQQKLAEVLGVSQPAVAQIEQRGNDIKLITLKRYIEAMQGTLKLAVTMPTGEERIFRI